jgi:hypothetical protein
MRPGTTALLEARRRFQPLLPPSFPFFHSPLLDDAESPPQSTMSDSITVHSSDGASLVVKRVHLLSNSSVFADMMDFSTPGDSVDLVETGEQLKPFLNALGGELEAFEKLDEEGLEDFARLADKYDSVQARELVRRKIWYALLHFSS